MYSNQNEMSKMYIAGQNLIKDIAFNFDSYPMESYLSYQWNITPKDGTYPAGVFSALLCCGTEDGVLYWHRGLGEVVRRKASVTIVTVLRGNYGYFCV